MLFQDVDIGVGGFTINEKRSKVVDFTVPFMEEPAVMIMRVSRANDKALMFLSPYSMQVPIPYKMS